MNFIYSLALFFISTITSAKTLYIDVFEQNENGHRKPEVFIDLAKIERKPPRKENSKTKTLVYVDLDVSNTQSEIKYLPVFIEDSPKNDEDTYKRVSDIIGKMKSTP